MYIKYIFTISFTNYIRIIRFVLSKKVTRCCIKHSFIFNCSRIAYDKGTQTSFV